MSESPKALISKVLGLCEAMKDCFQQGAFDDATAKAEERQKCLEQLFALDLREYVKEIEHMTNVIQTTDQEVITQSQQQQKTLAKSLNLIDLGRKAQSIYQEVQSHHH